MIRKYHRDMGKVARGYVRKVLDNVTTALDGVHPDLLTNLPQEPRYSIEEPGSKDNGHGMWTWCFRASLFSLFEIGAARSSDLHS